MANSRNFRRPPIKEQPNRINEQIPHREVRLVGDNVDQGVYPIQQARRIAELQGLDLVEISANAEPPVCRVRQKEQKAKQAKVVVKEIRFGPQTDDHDYNFKLRHAEGFLKDGFKVKAYVFFRGRSILFKDQGEILLLRFANDLEELARVESMPVLEGKRMTIMLAPKPASAKGKKKEPKQTSEEPTDQEASEEKDNE